MGSRLTLLCVDDDTDTLALLRAALEREFPDATVLTRVDAESGLVTLAVESVDVVISDSVVLDDGTPFVEAARNEYPKLPTVLYTGKTFSDVATVLGRAGVSEYVQKSGSDHLTVLVGHVERFAKLLDDADQDVDSEVLRVVEQAALDPAAWTTATRCNPASLDELLAALIETLGDRAEDRPLAQLVDVELLADMFASHRSSTPLQVRFSTDTHEVVVADDGVVAARPLTSD
jgi:CheY-like chemotaxis protein